jgi:glutaryl-CoA dehydrogenase
VASFPGVDYMDFDALLDEEQRLVRQTVRDFVDEKVVPITSSSVRRSRTTACPASTASRTA